MDINLEKIAAREREIAEAMKRLEREAADLAATRRVFERLGGKRAARDIEVLPDKAPRPEGTPTTWEMVSDALKANPSGLTSAEMIALIREKYWPGLVTGQILPSIYGFLKAERLKKDRRGKWLLP